VTDGWTDFGIESASLNYVARPKTPKRNEAGSVFHTQGPTAGSDLSVGRVLADGTTRAMFMWSVGNVGNMVTLQ